MVLSRTAGVACVASFSQIAYTNDDEKSSHLTRVLGIHYSSARAQAHAGPAGNLEFADGETSANEHPGSGRNDAPQKS